MTASSSLAPASPDGILTGPAALPPHDVIRLAGDMLLGLAGISATCLQLGVRHPDGRKVVVTYVQSDAPPVGEYTAANHVLHPAPGMVLELVGLLVDGGDPLTLWPAIQVLCAYPSGEREPYYQQYTYVRTAVRALAAQRNPEAFPATPTEPDPALALTSEVPKLKLMLALVAQMRRIAQRAVPLSDADFANLQAQVAALTPAERELLDTLNTLRLPSAYK